jgi:regulatory protein
MIEIQNMCSWFRKTLLLGYNEAMREKAKYQEKKASKAAKESGTVTSLQMQKRNKERVNVFLDGEFAFAIALNDAITLKKGQHLSSAEVEAFKRSGESDLAFQKAARYLGMRPRSSSEIVTYLKRKEVDETVVEDVVRRLHDKGYLDDEAFARFWVENRNRFRPRGAQALRHELRQKGVERETIDSTLEEQDEEGAAWAALQSKVDRWATLEKIEFEQKGLAFLARRGFRFDICRRTVNQAWNELQEQE